ncbi:MAG: polyphosphate:AMP phosphotransferase [Candidatus Hinthialibacter antarcticus]|nr:polyphosphate:AMP phosphotransferase [Candidatus Hinthialibacter antarcticus]
MLNTLDLDVSLAKEAYKEALAPLKERLVELQRAVVDAERPVLIVFEGIEACGKGDSIRQVVSPLDPRGFKVHLMNSILTEDEQYWPKLRRHWLRIPKRGEIAIYDKSWYMETVRARVEGELSNSDWSTWIDEVKQFERQLIDDGTVLIKFWLHISKKEQRDRFKVREKSAYEGWRVDKDSWKNHKKFNDYIEATDDIIVETDTPYAPWTLVPSTDRRYRRVIVLRTIVETLSRSLEQPPTTVSVVNHVPTPYEIRGSEEGTLLDRVDPTIEISREKYREDLDQYQMRLRQLEFACYAKRLPVILVYEGWDAGGKGGNIKRMTQKLDPRGYNVIPISAPQGEEATKHYLWRFWRHAPKAGHFAIFDRSWYGRVMVERVEGFCREDEWKRAYYEINEFERHLADFGTVILKFWLHISNEEQLRRFEEREQTPRKRYKLTEEDWRNREKWNEYNVAVSEMIERTNTNYAPWVIVEGDCKLHARIKTLKTLVNLLEQKLKSK